MAKTKTINLSQGGREIEYAKVSSRVAEFHKLNKQTSIRTAFEFKDGWAIFKATVIPDIGNLERYFNGSSIGKVGATKAFEKLETIAVGRALAFAGFLSDGEIASIEEMAIYSEVATVADNSSAVEKLKATKTKGELGKAWALLSQAEREDKEVQTLKETLKAQYGNSQGGTKVTGLATTPKGEDNGNGIKKDSGNEDSKG